LQRETPTAPASPDDTSETSPDEAVRPASEKMTSRESIVPSTHSPVTLPTDAQLLGAQLLDDQLLDDQLLDDRALDVQPLSEGDDALVIAPRAAERIVDTALATEENRRAYEQLTSRFVEDTRGFPHPCVGVAAVDGGGDSTLVVASVAELLANRFGSVLLLDGDSQQRCLSLLYGVADRSGLSDVVRGISHLQPNVYSTSKQVRIVSSGTNFQQIDPPSADKWGAMLSRARRLAPITVVDLGVIQAGSSAELARLCEAVYLVVSLGRTQRYLYDVVARQLPTQGVRLQGAIAAF